MAQRARANAQKTIFPRARTFGPAAVSARQRFEFLWSRESLLRLILSFVLSIALWLYVSNKQNPSLAQDFGQPLSVVPSNTPEGLTMVNNGLIPVYIRYKRHDLNTVATPASFHPFVDLSGLTPGRHRVRIQVVADPGIEIVGKNPATEIVQLERSQRRPVPVNANVVSHPPTGYGWKQKVEPSTVTVSGPARFVSQVARATYDLDLSNSKSTVSSFYRVRPENSQGGVVPDVSLTPSQIRVTVSVQPWSSYKALPVLVSLDGQPKSGYGVVAVRVSPSQITAYGSPSKLNDLTTVKTAPVSVARRGAGDVVRRVKLVLPKGVTSHPRWVTVRTRLKPVEASSSIEVGVRLSGLAPGLSVQTQPRRVLATVVGPSTKLSAAGAHMQAVLDLSGYPAGVYTLTPTVTAPKGLSLEDWYPKTVTVTLSAAP